MLSVRLSPSLITAVVAVPNKKSMGKNSYLSVFLDAYLKGSARRGIVRLFSCRAWHFRGLKIVRRLGLSHILLLPRLHPDVRGDLDAMCQKWMKLHDRPVLLPESFRAVSQALFVLMRLCVETAINLASRYASAKLKSGGVEKARIYRS